MDFQTLGRSSFEGFFFFAFCLFSFFSTNGPSQDFTQKLKDHILCRLLGIDPEGGERSFPQATRNRLIFVGDKLYRHKVLRINYTTYDNRRVQDSLNPRSYANIMVFSHEGQSENFHPYWYARIIGLFHAEIKFHEPGKNDHSNSQKVDSKIVISILSLCSLLVVYSPLTFFT